MKFGLVYVSPNGTTKTVSKLLKSTIEKDGHSVKEFNLGSIRYRENPEEIRKVLEDLDIVGFGSPAYHMDMLLPMKRLLEEMSKNRKNYNYSFKAFIFLNYCGITSGKAFTNTVKSLKESEIPVIAGLKIVAPHFHHAEKFPSKDTVNIIEEFYNNIKSKKFESIQWSRAKKVFSPEKKIVNILYPLAHIVGKKREIPININDDKCIKCKKCIKECPTGAISQEDTVVIDSEKCIHCYHCVVACSFQAVESPVEKLDKMIRINKKIVGVENPLNKIYL